jgi:hypothetical protein
MHIKGFRRAHVKLAVGDVADIPRAEIATALLERRPLVVNLSAAAYAGMRLDIFGHYVSPTASLTGANLIQRRVPQRPP